jgi:hypothetical protein
MGLFSKGPSAGEIASAQGSANKKAATESARLSAVDQFSPFGSTHIHAPPLMALQPAQTIKPFHLSLQRTLDCAVFGTAGDCPAEGRPKNLAGSICQTEAFSLKRCGVVAEDVTRCVLPRGLCPTLASLKMDRPAVL